MSAPVHTLERRAPVRRTGSHPAWRAFIRFCRELDHGEIERLRIQNGLPMIAEVTKKKVKFNP